MGLALTNGTTSIRSVNKARRLLQSFLACGPGSPCVYRQAGPTSRQCDIAVDLESEVDTAHCDDGLPAIVQAALRVSIARYLFDPPLGGDAELLEEFA
jgi:hypothetical protein